MILPLWQCHKQVRAIKIGKIEQSPAEQENDCGGTWDITPADELYPMWTVPHAFIDKHRPEVGGYFVLYDDGYISFSPAAAFEAGYTRITEPTPPTEGDSNG